MGNWISKLYKDHFFAFKVKMKNYILFFKGKTEVPLKCVPGVKIIQGVHSIKNCSSTSYTAIQKDLRGQAKATFVCYPKKKRRDLKMIHDENDGTMN